MNSFCFSKNISKDKPEQSKRSKQLFLLQNNENELFVFQNIFLKLKPKQSKRTQKLFWYIVLSN